MYFLLFPIRNNSYNPNVNNALVYVHYRVDVAGRSKRQKVDKHGRMSALEKLKQLKSTGSKRKYEVDTLENVYDTVDESEYTDRVLQRREDDWIDDDGIEMRVVLSNYV